MTISEAKMELYYSLKSKSDEIIGSGITEKNNVDVIVILLSKPKSKINIEIPSLYKDYKVITQVRKVPSKKVSK